MSKDRIDEILQDEQDPLTEEASERVKDAWSSIASSRRGRVVIRDLLLLTRFGKSALGYDTNHTMVNAGLQLVGEYLMEKLIEANPEGYALIIKEANEDEEYDRQQRDDNNRNT